MTAAFKGNTDVTYGKQKLIKYFPETCNKFAERALLNKAW